MLQAILFDLDNTLYPDSNGLMRAVDARIIAYLGAMLQLDADQALALRRRYYATYGTTLRGLQLHHTVDTEHFLASVHDLAFEEFLAADAELDALLGQVRATKAIFTNSPTEHAREVLGALGVAHHFAMIFDIRFQQFVPKPDAAGYRAALAALGAAPTQTVMVEDTLRNLATARELGMRTIFVGDPPSGDHPADLVVPDVLAALRAIVAIEAGGA